MAWWFGDTLNNIINIVCRKHTCLACRRFLVRIPRGWPRHCWGLSHILHHFAAVPCGIREVRCVDSG